MTFTTPHIPEHTPPDRVERIVHRNLYVPTFVNLKAVESPDARVTLETDNTIVVG